MKYKFILFFLWLLESPVIALNPYLHHPVDPLKTYSDQNGTVETKGLIARGRILLQRAAVELAGQPRRRCVGTRVSGLRFRV